MSNTTIKKVNKFGKIGNIIITILIVVTMIFTAATVFATGYLLTLPKDGVVVSMASDAKIQVNSEDFGKLWDLITDGFAYSTSDDQSTLLSDDNTDVMPPENQEMQMNLKFFNHDFSSATIRSEGSQKIIDATTDISVYKSGDFVKVLVFSLIFLISVAVSLWMLKGLFKTIAECESPFSETIVKKMHFFSFSLIPVAVFASVAETLSNSFLSSGKGIDICIQWGVIIAFIVAISLVTVFKYGVQLQRESDETL